MILFASGPAWLSFDQGQVATLPAFPVPAGPATVLWAPASGVTGVAALEGNPRHAPVLIERRLRSEGSIEGEAKVLIHHFRTIGRGYQALYSVVPLDELQSMLAWVRNLPDHCLLFPGAALLWAGLRDGEGAVFHNGVQMLFLGMAQGQIVHANTIAFGAGPEDIELAARALGEKVRTEWADLRLHGVVPELPISWYSVRAGGHPALGAEGPDLEDESSEGRDDRESRAVDDGTAQGQGGIRAFAESSGRVVISKDEVLAQNTAHTREASGHHPVHSGLVQLARYARSDMALNPSGDKWRYTASRLLPVCTALCLVSSVALLATSGSWMVDSGKVSAEVGRLAQRDTVIRQRVAGFAGTGAMPNGLDDQIEFFESAKRLAGGRDVAGLLKALQLSSSADIRILGVRAEDSAKSETLKTPTRTRLAPTGATTAQSAAPEAMVSTAFVVDGLLSEAGIGQDSTLLSSWVRSMRSRGYELEAVDAKVPTAGNDVSSRLFSYRVQPAAAMVEGARP